MSKPELKRVIEEAIAAGEILQVYVEDDDGAVGWAVIDPSDKTCTWYDEPMPGIRIYPPEAAN